MATILDRRLATLEANARIRFDKIVAFLIFDDDRADAHVGAQTYERTRHIDETPEEFQRRVLAEAGTFSSRMVSISRSEYQAIIAEIDADV